MGKRQDSIASADQDAGGACTSTTRSHADDNLPSTSSRSFRGFSSSSPGPYHQSPSFEASSAPVADFSAGHQHRGVSTRGQPNAPPNPPQSISHTYAYHEGFVDGYCQATLSGAAAPQVGPPFVPAVPGPSVGATLQPCTSSTLLSSLTNASSSSPRQTLPATGAGPVVHSQVPSWVSAHTPQSFGRNRNSAALSTLQLDPPGVASTSTPHASTSLPSTSRSVVIVPLIPGPQGDKPHECTWAECGKSFRRRYLLRDHVSYAHHGIAESVAIRG